MRSFVRFLVTCILFQLLVGTIALGGLSPQNSPPPTNGSEQTAEKVARLEARIKTLEERYEQSSGFRDSDYILRIQRQYETYYEKAFNTQVTVVWAVGIIFTAMLALAGRFSFVTFEKKVDYAILAATGELKSKFDRSLTDGLAKLERENREYTAKAVEDLKSTTVTAIRDLRQRNEFDLQISQGLIFANSSSFKRAREHFLAAVNQYLKNKTAYISKQDCGTTLSNFFRTFLREDKPEFSENAKRGLQDLRFDDLQDELRLAAESLPELAPLLQRDS